MRRRRRGRQMAGGTITPLHEWIIDLYAPYVFVRCAGFTNDRDEALLIGAYTLITTCLMAERLDHPGQLGISVDVVADVVGPDVVGGCEDPFLRHGGGELLIPDERTRDLAEALNMLERPMREAIVLHHLGGLAESSMARVLNRPAAEIAARITRGERLLAGYLSGFRPDGGVVAPCAVRSLLAEFEAALDARWVREVRDCAIDYLARGREPIHSRAERWRLN